MATDLIKRLRDYDYEFPLLREAAADTIERQAAEIEQLKSRLNDVSTDWQVKDIQLTRQAAEIAKYDELLDAISEFHGLETKHETALRYIRAAEASRNAMLPKGASK